MGVLIKRDLADVAHWRGDCFASIYLPKETVGAAKLADQIRFKNLLKLAEDGLRQRGRSPAEVQKMIEPARALFNVPQILETARGGLAVFLSHNHFGAWNLPFACAEQCVVAGHPLIVPILPIQSDAPYYVLAISQNQIRLLRGTQYRLDEIEVPGLPADMEDALHYDRREGMFQTHSGQPQLRGKESAVFHGQGGLADVKKNELASFFREVDRAVASYLKGRNELLLFAGVDYLLPIYREVNNYPHLAQEYISGNPELLSHDDLRKSAWPVLESLVRQQRTAAVARYWDGIARDEASNRLEDVLVAAHAGVVETLFIDPSVRRIGTFAPESCSVRIDQRPQPDGEDLINLAALLVLRSSGMVESVQSGNIPGGGAVAAVYRYVFPPIAAQLV
jgi:hypothetical protein